MELRFASEMEKKTYLQVCRAEVAEELQRGIWREAFCRFDLDHELLVDDHIESLSREWLAPKVDHHPDLAIDLVTVCPKIVLEG
jgi:hypothetical protein